MRPVGYLGGTFDPVHRGHLRIAELAHAALGLERIEFLPSGFPPHKRPEELAPRLARWTMVELAVLDRPEWLVSPLELFSDRPTFTVETLERIELERPGEESWWILGADALRTIGNWHRSPELLDRFRFVAVARPGSEARKALEQEDARVRSALEAGRLVWIEGPCHPASSTRIRELLSAGRKPPRGWVPPKVLNYIEKYQLYR